MYAAIPSAFMALNCHNNYFQVIQSTKYTQNIKHPAIKVFAAAFVFCALIYVAVTLAGASLFGESTQSNILINLASEDYDHLVQAKLIRVVYLLIPLFNIPPLFMTVKDSCIQMYAEFRYAAVSSRQSQSSDHCTVSNLISKNEYRVITVTLLFVAILLAIVLKDVGTVSRFSTLTFATGLRFLGICEYHGQHIATTPTVSAHLVQMQPRTRPGALGTTIRSTY